MEGKNIFNELVSKRDYSGSTADEYAQFLLTLMFHLGEAIFPLLEKAVNENKRLALKPEILSSNIPVDEYFVSDVVLI